MTNRLNREVKPEVERLEERSLLAVGTAQLVGRTLVIQGPAGGGGTEGGTEGGGGGAINVRVAEKHGKIRVIFTDTAANNAQTIVEFKESSVKMIDFRGTDGDDVFVNTSDTRVIANGGAGNDFIATGDERATVTGGAGADTIISENKHTVIIDRSPEDIIRIDD